MAGRPTGMLESLAQARAHEESLDQARAQLRGHVPQVMENAVTDAGMDVASGPGDKHQQPAAGVSRTFLPIKNGTLQEHRWHTQSSFAPPSDAKQAFHRSKGPNAGRKQFSNLGSGAGVGHPRPEAKQYVIATGSNQAMLPVVDKEVPIGKIGHLSHGSLLPSEFHRLGTYGSYGNIYQNIG